MKVIVCSTQICTYFSHTTFSGRKYMKSLKLHCCCSVTKSCPTLCDAMNYSMPGFPVLHYLPKCSNSSPLSRWCYLIISCSAAFFSSCFQCFPASGSFPIVSSLHLVAKVLELQNQPFQWIFRVDFLKNRLVWSPCSPKDSPAPQFESINSSGTKPSLRSNSHIHTRLLDKPYKPL